MDDKERFQYWLADMDDAIERFVASLPNDVRDRLDYSDDSLIALEHCVLARYPSPAETEGPEQSLFLDGASRYLGEVFRRRLGVQWNIQFDDPEFAFNGIPVLTGGRRKGNRSLCPLALITASTDRRKGDFYATVLRSNLE